MRKRKEIKELIPEEPQGDICPVGEPGEPGVKKEKNKDIPEFYVLKIGETLADVAKKFGVSEASLKELNGEVFGTNQIKVR